MFDKCFAKIVTGANGKPLTQAQRDNLRKRFSAAFLESAKSGNDAGDAILRALEKMRADAIHEIKLKQHRAMLNAAAQSQLETFARANADKFKGGAADAIWRMISTHSDRLSNIQSAESFRNALIRKYSPLVHEINRAIGTDATGFIENAQNSYLFTKALFDDASGIPPEFMAKYNELKPLARKWLDAAESMRQQFNRYGGDVGKLADWIMPQSWDGKLMRDVGQKQWVADMLEQIDRSRYVDDETGLIMDDNQIISVLESAYKNITTEGGAFSKQSEITSIQNRGKAERVLHMKNADAYVAMQGKYGRMSMQSAMANHIEGMASNIALTKTLGPGYQNNISSVINKLRDEMRKAAAESGDWKQVNSFDLASKRAQYALMEIAGSGGPPRIPNKFVEFLQGMRNLSMIKLGGSWVSSLTDNANAQAYARLNKISGADLVIEQLKNLDPTDETRKVQMQNAGLVPEVYLHSVYRDVHQMMRAGWTKGLSDATMQLSLMPIATRARSAAFGAAMQNAIGAKLQKFATLDEITGSDGDILRGLGVTADDWQVWRLAKPDSFGNVSKNYLTPDSIYGISDDALKQAFPGEFAGKPETHAKIAADMRDDAVIKLLGTVDSESRAAVLQPGANIKSLMNNRAMAGTARGELWAAVMQFKQFPFAIIEQTIMRMRGMDNWGRAAFAAHFIGGTTIMGALILQANHLLNGKDPEDVTEGDFWVRAALKGGALGIAGDALFMDKNKMAQFVAGPVLGDIFNTAEIATRPMRKGMEGGSVDYNDMAADLIRQVNQANPAAKLWYSRGAFDHIVTHDIQESLSPGYLNRMQARTFQQTGNKYWWRPGESMPNRAPDFSNTWEVD